jgi:acetyl esterase/lipase
VLDLFRGIGVSASKSTTGILFSEPSGTPLHLDVHQPAASGSFPILIQIYGGAWQRGAPGDNAAFASLLAAHGWVVFAIDYRHAPRFRWPAQLDDVRAALVWVRDHAASYDGDTSRVVLMGRSAGGHLAMMAAYTDPPVRVRGVVSYYGPADLADAYYHPPRPDPLDIRAVDIALIGGPPDTKTSEYDAASPISYVGRPQPPTLLVYGARDNIVEARYARTLRDRLLAGGTKVAYLEIPWAGHGFDAVFNGVSSQLALYHTERFLTWAVDAR